MKKKLLTVLLSAVMIFGVFGLTACSGSNPDDNYNYYASRYEVQGDVHITAVTYLSVYKMLQNSGTWLLYVDKEEGDKAADRFQAINKLAQDWNVEIYHFNPVLSGGYHESDVKDKIANWATSDLLTASLATSNKPVEEGISNLYKELVRLTSNGGISWTAVKDQQLLAIKGAEQSWAIDGDVTPASGKEGAKATLVATPNGKITAANSYDKGNKTIAAVAQKKVSYGQYNEKEADRGKVVPENPAAYDTENINTFNIFGDNRFHMYEEGVDAYTAEKNDVFVALANYKQFAWLLDNNNGMFEVFFGGAWCPNTQAIAYLSNSVAKDYGINKVYFFDPQLDDFAMVETASLSLKEGASASSTNAADYDIVVNKASGSGAAGYMMNTRTMDWAGTGKAASAATNYSYSHLYGYFLTEYLNTYKSYWNLVPNTAADTNLIIKVNGENKNFGKMAVPNIMIFNGESEGKAELLKWAEAEYDYGNEQHARLWTEAVKEVYDQNKYAHYNPIIEEEATEEESSSSSAAPSAPAASTGPVC